jgi:hypothetical protein
VQDPDEEHEYFSSFKLCSIFIKDHHLQNVLLSPTSVMTFRTMLQKKAGIKAFPFCQIRRYKQITVIDMNNTFGKGYNTIVAINGNDKTKGLVIA